MNDLIIYNTDDGKSHVALLVVENEAWLTQNQLAELFDTSVQNITLNIKNILQKKHFRKISWNVCIRAWTVNSDKWLTTND